MEGSIRLLRKEFENRTLENYVSYVVEAWAEQKL